MDVEVEGLKPDDLDDLVRELAEQGHQATRRRRGRKAWVPEVGLWVLEHLGPVAARALARTVASWARRRFQRRDRPATVKVYGPRGEVLAEVEVEDEPD